MKDREPITDEAIDGILARAADRGLGLEPGRRSRDALGQLESSLFHGLRPVRPLPAGWVFILAFMVLCAVVAWAIAATVGLDGVRALSPLQRAAIFPALLAVAWLSATGSSRAMRPAGGRALGWPAFLLAVVGFPLLCLAVFHNFNTQHFVQEGIPCLENGLKVSIPVGVIVALILARGFVMRWCMAGLAAGTLSGLTGLAMLELHCPSPKTLHILVWHTAVVAVSGLIGYLLGWLADSIRRAASPGRGA